MTTQRHSQNLDHMIMLVTKINVVVAHCIIRQISILDHVIIYDYDQKKRNRKGSNILTLLRTFLNESENWKELPERKTMLANNFLAFSQQNCWSDTDSVSAPSWDHFWDQHSPSAIIFIEID